MAARNYQSGFTLVELIMVIVIMGVIGGTVAVFMKSPIDAYFDTARRAGIADVADTTVRRMARDIRKALPNSIRLSGTQCVEFIPTRTGGRYRAEEITAGDESSLKFTAADQSFNMLGLNSALPADQQIKASSGVNDLVAVYNLGISGSDAYAGNNTAVITGVNVSPLAANETEIKLVGNITKFPLASASNRFHIIPGDEKIVSYICGADGKLYRNANYSYGTSCPAPTTGTTPVIATEATCDFAYTTPDIRNGLVQLSLTFSKSGEAVSIYHEVHVNNTP
jgi:MSHA biogenesis protein MshO